MVTTASLSGIATRFRNERRGAASNLLLLLLLLLLALLLQRMKIEAALRRHVVTEDARVGPRWQKRQRVRFRFDALNAHADVDALLRTAAVHAAVGWNVRVAAAHGHGNVRLGGQLT